MEKKGHAPPQTPREGFTPQVETAILSHMRGKTGAPWAFLFAPTSGRVLAYRCQLRGIELRAARRITWDLHLNDLDLAATPGPFPVEALKKAVEANQ